MTERDSLKANTESVLYTPVQTHRAGNSQREGEREGEREEREQQNSQQERREEWGEESGWFLFFQGFFCHIFKLK